MPFVGSAALVQWWHRLLLYFGESTCAYGNEVANSSPGRTAILATTFRPFPCPPAAAVAAASSGFPAPQPSLAPAACSGSAIVQHGRSSGCSMLHDVSVPALIVVFCLILEKFHIDLPVGFVQKFYNNKKMKFDRGLLVATLLVVLVGVASQDNNPRAPLHQVLEHARELSRKLDQAKVTSTAEHAHSSNRYVHLSNFKQFLFLIFAATFARV